MNKRDADGMLYDPNDGRKRDHRGKIVEKMAGEELKASIYAGIIIIVGFALYGGWFFLKEWWKTV